MKDLIIQKKLDNSQKEELENFIQEFGNVSIWQTPLWNEVVLLESNQTWFILKENKKISAFCVVIERIVIARITFGPIYKEEKSGFEILESIYNYYKKGFIGLLYIQPEIMCSGIFNSSLTEKLNCRVKKTTTTWATKLINLSQSEEAIYSKFNQNHKRSIKKAKDAGFIVKALNPINEYVLFYGIYKEMHEHRKIQAIISDEKIFVDLCDRLVEKNKCFIYGIYDSNDKLQGAALFIKEGNRLIYQFGASRKEIKMPLLHLVFHKTIIDAKNNNFEHFDLGGYAKGDNINEQTNNINRFKDGFNGELIVYPTSISVEINPIIAIFVKIIKLVL
ncbi:MAG: GNAT family N-acetyltransferase [Bacteroidota bacterium]